MKLLIAFSALAGFAVSQNVQCVKPLTVDVEDYVAAKYPDGPKIDLKSIQAKIDKINADILKNNPSIGKGDIIDKKALAEKYGDKLKATLEKIQEQKKIKLQKKDEEAQKVPSKVEDNKQDDTTAEDIKKAAKKAEKKLNRQMEKAAVKAKKKIQKEIKKKNGMGKNKKNKKKKNGMGKNK